MNLDQSSSITSTLLVTHSCNCAQQLLIFMWLTTPPFINPVTAGMFTWLFPFYFWRSSMVDIRDTSSYSLVSQWFGTSYKFCTYTTKFYTGDTVPDHYCVHSYSLQQQHFISGVSKSLTSSYYTCTLVPAHFCSPVMRESVLAVRWLVVHPLPIDKTQTIPQLLRHLCTHQPSSWNIEQTTLSLRVYHTKWLKLPW